MISRNGTGRLRSGAFGEGARRAGGAKERVRLHFYRKLMHDLDDSLTDDDLRRKIQFQWVYRILLAVSLGMTVVNILTGKRLLGWSTFIFALLCGLDLLIGLYGECGQRVSSALFVGEILALFTFFIVSGTPEGFSAIWICLLPSCGLLLFGRLDGTIVSAVMLAVVIFFFDTPAGVSCLQYPYTASFKLRFPMLYLAFYLVSLFLETVRIRTQKKLLETQAQYRYLYVHDALTGLYNRYGFNEQMDRLFSERAEDGASLLIVDIDHFKRINDSFGHEAGDGVLRTVAERLARCVGERGAVCRWGGEEFAVLLGGWREAPGLGDAICSAMREPMALSDGTPVSVTVSVGAFSAQTAAGIPIAEFVNRTDRCLYRAKAEGRDRTVAERAEKTG